MWKVSGKRIFPRWQKIRQTATKYKNTKTKEGRKALCVIGDKSQSNEGNDWKQHARKQHSFWDDPAFHNHSICNGLLETVGIVGTTAFCLDLQHRHCTDPHVEKRNGCLFSMLAYAMPFGSKKQSLSNAPTKTKINVRSKETKKPETTNNGDIDATSKEVHRATMNSVAAIENAVGVMYLQKDEKEAFEFFRASAQLGCPKGLYNLGLCYEMGRGTAKNLSKAAHYYRQAASKGHSFAIYNLAVFTLKGMGGISQNLDEGLDLLKEASEKGVPEAQFSLGMYFLEEEKYEEAFKMFSESSQSNSIDGKYYLGLCYENGWGTEKNLSVATELFAQAARNGHDEATLKLGNSFENGYLGVDPDVEFSMTLYHMLAEKGHNGGKHALQALKDKQESQWKFKSTSQNSNRTVEDIHDKQPASLHTSSSVPEFRNYSSYCKIEHSRSLLHSMISLNNMHFESVDRSRSSTIIEDLDLPDRPNISFHIGMPQILLANS